MSPISLIVLWAGLILLVLWRWRRIRRIGAVLLPALVIQGLVLLLSQVLAFVSPEILSLFSQVITSLNLGLAVLLIFADKIVGGSRLRAVGWSFGVMIVVSAMVIGLNNGLVLSNKVLALTVLHSIGVPALVLGIAFAFRMSRGRRNYILALGWLFFGLIVFSAGLAALSMGVMFYLEGPVHDEQFEVFASAFLFGAILGEILCIIVLPYVFLVLSDRSFRRWLNTFWG